MSYVFRPLTKNKYIAKNGDYITVLAKGKDLFPEVESLVTLGGGEHGKKRVNEVSKVAAMLEVIGISSVDNPNETEYQCFVPSACWRKIRTNILSTARFMGILFVRKHRLAVYDIGDGSMEWQLRAERSLFYSIYHEPYSTHATGMLFICNVVTLVINEPLPQMKELTSAVHDHWLELIHTAIRKAAQRQKLPYFDKAFVCIEITTHKYANDSQVWDTSNRAINLVINNLKGIFFKDDNLEHMAFSVTGTWGDEGKTVMKIMSFDKFTQIL